MKLLSFMTVIAAISALPFATQAYTGQQHIFTRAGLNGNICRSAGNNCHMPQPQNRTLSMTQPVLPPQAQPATASSSLTPAGSGLIGRAWSGFTSLF